MHHRDGTQRTSYKFREARWDRFTPKIRLSNPRRAELAPIDVDALVVTCAITLCIPEHIAIQLALDALEQWEVTTAEGKKTVCPYVGPVQVMSERRNSFTGALILGDAVLLEAIPIEDMDLVIHLTSRTLSVNPDSPNIPSVLVK
jgi:clan AA aspartic protease